MGIKHSFASAKADGGDATLIKPSNWNDNHTIDSEVTFPDVASPATPSAGNFNLYGKTFANRTMPTIIGASGMDYALQPATWRQKIGLWTPAGNITTVPAIVGMGTFTATGTATARTVATTNLFTRTRKLGYVSAATAAALTGIRMPAAQYTTGNGSGLGGVFTSIRFGVSDAAAVTGARMFVGLSSATGAPTNVDPATLTNCIGIAQLSGDATQLYIVYGGSSAQTTIPLGTNFPPMAGVGIANGIAYDMTIFAPPNSNGVIHYEVERIGTAFTATGTLTPTVVGTQTPASTTLLTHQIWRTNNATLLAVGIDILNIYVETDY